MSTQPDSTAARGFAGVFTLICGVGAALLASLRFLESVTVRDTPLWQIVWAAVAIAGGLLALRVGGRRITAACVGVALFAFAFATAGLPELPPWASVEAFGKSPWFAVLMPIIAALALVVAWRRHTPVDAVLVLFVVFSAFGGPMWVRTAIDFNGLFVLFALAGLALAQDARGADRRGIPCLWPFAVLLAISVAALFTAVNRDAHAQGVLRMLAAGLPLIGLGRGPIDAGRVFALARTFAVVVLAGFACAALVILESGYHFDLRLAMRAQLTLFGEHPNIIAPYFAVAPPLLLGLLPDRRSWFARGLVVLAIVAAIGGLALTNSKTALAGAAGGIGAFVVLAGAVFVMRRRPGRLTPLLLTLAAVVIAAGGIFALRAPLKRQFATESMQFRAYLWRTATSAIEERPLLGYGYLTGEPLMAHATSSDLDGRSKDTHPHMLVLAIAMGAGIPAAIAFGVLVLLFLGRTIGAAARLGTLRERALAIGVAASALALLAANSIDQGLALNTPFPFHLGLLIGMGALFVRAARPAPDAVAEAPLPQPGCVRRTLPRVAIAACAVICLATLAAERCAARANIADRAKDTDRAIRHAALASTINPFALSHGLLHARLLAAQRDLTGALEIMHRLTRQHPLSALPWDRISELEVERRVYKEVLKGLQNATERDPTGPMVSSWKQREADFWVLVKNQLKAEEAYAETIRYDFEIVHRIQWRHAEGNTFYLNGPDRRILLDELWRTNQTLLPEVVQADAVRGRRMATTLVKELMQFHRFSTAKKVLDDYKRLTSVPWLPLQQLEIELYRTWDPETNEVRQSVLAQAGASASDVIPVESDGGERTAVPTDFGARIETFADQAGSSALYIAEGERLLATGAPEQALASFATARQKIYDMIAERHYLTRLVDGVLQAHCDRRDVGAARAALRAALYFNSTPNKRVERQCWFALALQQAHLRGDALDVLADAAVLVPRLANARGEQVLHRLAECLAQYLASGADASLQSRATALLDGLGDSAPGATLHAYTLIELDRLPEARTKLEEIQRSWPDWARELKPFDKR